MTVNNLSSAQFDEKSQKLLEKASKQHDADIEIIESLSGGKSNAKIYLAKLDNQQCVLKIDSSSRDKFDRQREDEKHKTAHKKYSPAISDRMVDLIGSTTKYKDKVAMFYAIAGRSFNNVRPLGEVINEPLASTFIADLVEDLLSDWSVRKLDEPFKRMKPQNALYEQLDFLEDRQKIEKLRGLLEEYGVTWNTPSFIIGNVIYPNPILYTYEREHWENSRPIDIVRGRVHGDLNLNNILVQMPFSKESTYYLIDFANFRSDTCFGFEIAYIELQFLLSQIPYHFPDLDELLLGEVAQIGATSDLSQMTGALAEKLKPIREKVSRFFAILSEDLGNQDDLWSGFHLAGIATGMRIANVAALDKIQRLVALTYAAGHMYRVNQDLKLSMPSKSERIGVSESKTLSNTTRLAWQDLLERTDYFDSSYLYLGVFGPLDNADEHKLRGFSYVPWNVIIDFDYSTDIEGLYSICSASLEDYKAVRLLTLDDRGGTYRGETAYWFAANGLPGRVADQKSLDVATWRRSYSRHLNGFLREYADSTSRPVVVFIFWNNPTFVDSIMSSIDSCFGDRSAYFHIYPEALPSELPYEFSLPVDVEYFSWLARQRLSDRHNQGQHMTIPGLKMSVELSESKLRWLEEDVEVLHFDIGLTPDPNVEGDGSQDFYRGRSITWYELACDKDIRRDEYYESLYEILHSELNERVTSRVMLYHYPGAGGTTLAHRIAWNFHRKFPTVILKDDTDGTLEKLREIFHITGAPILAVIETSPVDKLYLRCRSENIAVVFLIIRRSFTPPQHEREQVVYIPEVLRKDEALALAERYRQLVDNKQRREALEELLSKTDRRYQTPFFFGLTAFEDDYLNLSDYVRERLPANNDLLHVVMYISMAHYHAQQVISTSLFADILTLPQNRVVHFQKVFAHKELSLLVQEKSNGSGEKWKPLHPLVAEEIMRQVMGLSPEQKISEYLTRWVVEFIQYFASMQQFVGEDNDAIDSLIQRVFIERDDQPDIAYTSSKYSRIIENVSLNERRKVIFQEIVKCFPRNPHYHAHLGRFIWDMEKNYESALEHIDRAIQLSDQNEWQDYQLYHMRGMALRQWASSFMDKQEEEYYSHQRVDSDAVERINELFNQSLLAFDKVRQLDPTSEHGYIAAIQAHIRMVEHGFKTSVYDAYSDYLTSHQALPFLRHLEQAEYLLEKAKLLYDTDDFSQYIVTSQTDLMEFYGDYSRVIEAWTNMLDAGRGDASTIRRNLARAYLSRKDYDWNRLSEREVNRIRDLMEDNLLHDAANEHNLRLWFQAYRQTQSPNLDDAIERIAAWAHDTTHAVEPYYYLFVMHAIKVIGGTQSSINAYDRALTECKKRSVNRRNRHHSFEWLGNGLGLQRLVHQSRLGEWDKSKPVPFFTNTSLLTRIEGRVSSYNPERPQSGTLTLNSELDAFFIPGLVDGIVRLNTRVTCYLGFSYDGLRAWSVELLT